MENLHCTDFFVAAPIVAYNMFMNGVDCMDQYCATLAAQWREKRVHMTILQFSPLSSTCQLHRCMQFIRKYLLIAGFMSCHISTLRGMYVTH